MRHLTPLALCACALAALPARGQAPPPPKESLVETQFLRDLAETRGFMLGRPVKATPTPDGKAVLFLRGRARSPRLSLYEFDVATAKTRELLTPEQLLKGAAEKLSPEEKARRERMRVSVGGFAGFQLSPDGSLILLSLSGKLYTVERAGGASRELPTGPGPLLDPRFSPDGKSVSYVRGHDVYALDLAAQKEHAVTTGGTEEVSHGLAEFVAQEEMDRYSGYWWSPDSKHIAYEEADARGVEVWYVADPSRPGQRPQPQFYPRPGKANVKVRLGVVPASGGQTVWVEWDRARYPYLGAVHWGRAPGGEGGPLLLTVQTRDQTELAVLRADPATGKTSLLLKETDPAWVNLRQEVPRWLADGSGFLWVSEREGGPRLELRSPEGGLRQPLVPPDGGFQGLLTVDVRRGQFVYNASTDPTESRVVWARLRTGKTIRETSTPGLESAVFAHDHSVYALTVRPKKGMPRTTVHAEGGKPVGELPSVAENPPFVPRVEYVKPGGGIGFYAAVVRPRSFDPGKRYPVIVDVYGGPHHKQVVAAEGRWLLDQWYADQGFIVVAIDGRGTPDRGRAWERAIKDRFGSVPLDDQVAGLQELGKRFPEMDLGRVGIDGWSFGGYMAALAVMRRPDVFKAAVAGAPVVDWMDYDTHYTERYLGVPPKDEAGYKEGSLLTYAGDLRRPLLLLHGTADDNVFFRHSLRLVDALFRAGKDVQILPLPSLTHMVPDPVVMERLHGRIALFFRRHLGEPTVVRDGGG
jgi:dipeptidyl-peptidase-4